METNNPDDSEVLERKREWLHHECTEKIRKELVKRREHLINQLLGNARVSSDPDVREFATALTEVEQLIEVVGLKKIGARE